jgi:polysaccharide deacetylase 2 family uncharacterized protein YibQ
MAPLRTTMRMRVTRVQPLLWAIGLLAAATAGLGSLAVLSSRPASASRATPQAPTACRPEAPCLGVLIDDVGRDLVALDQLLALKLDLTFAVLPHAAHTTASVAAIRSHGREILLHLPMLPLDKSRITDEVVVLGRDGPLEAALQACLEPIPEAVGINNHMGSALTRDPAATRRLLRAVANEGLWVVDSRTTEGSLLCNQAKVLGVPCLERDVFLDATPDRYVVLRRLAQAVQVARRRGWALAIGHPHPATINLLRRLESSDSGVRVRRVSELVLLANGT